MLGRMEVARVGEKPRGFASKTPFSLEESGEGSLRGRRKRDVALDGKEKKTLPVYANVQSTTQTWVSL